MRCFRPVFVYGIWSEESKVSQIWWGKLLTNVFITSTKKMKNRFMVKTKGSLQTKTCSLTRVVQSIDSNFQLILQIFNLRNKSFCCCNKGIFSPFTFTMRFYLMLGLSFIQCECNMLFISD